MSVAIEYRNPRRPGEAGVVLICENGDAARTKESLERRGFVIVDDKAAGLGDSH
jgi:hypothetical protein